MLDIVVMLTSYKVRQKFSQLMSIIIILSILGQIRAL